MTKISWTCPQCGMWYSVPKDGSHMQPILWTYDGIERAKAALEGLVYHLSAWVPHSPELLLRIASHPAEYVPFWARHSAKEAKALRIFTCFPVANQPFRLFCQRCEFDATDVMKAGTPESVIVNIPMVKKMKDLLRLFNLICILCAMIAALYLAIASVWQTTYTQGMIFMGASCGLWSTARQWAKEL